MAIERIEGFEGNEHDEGNERYESSARVMAQSAGLCAGDEPPSSVRVARWRRKVAAALERAEAAIDHEPDRAACLLDEALRQMIGLWLARHGRDARLEGESLEGIEDVIAWADPCVGLQLGLALRASDARARRRHCHALLVLIEREDVGLEPADAGCGAKRVEARRPLASYHRSAFDPASDDETK
jgi:hypothetical protein